MRALARKATIGPGAVPAPMAQGHEVGPYQLLGKIATGGMGAVYLCRRSGYAGFQRLMALKLMHPHLTDQTQFLRMFLDEARIAGRMHHPNAVAILDLGKSPRGPYVVMEYIEGCTLAQLLGRHKTSRSPRFIVPIMMDVLSGLHAAHQLCDDDGVSLGLVHRDVSPSNILLGVDGIARITDFGIAKARARFTHTPAGTRKGKLSFAAPEQIRAGTCDPRSDVFSAGVVLWSSLTGKSLFRGDSDAQTVGNVLNRDIPPPSKIGLRPPECLDEICLRALQRDPAERYQSAADMADALRAVASRHALLGTPIEIGRWVSATFADQLEARRQVVAAEEPPVSLPSLPEIDEAPTEVDGALSVRDVAGPSRLRRLAAVAVIAAMAGSSSWLARHPVASRAEPAAVVAPRVAPVAEPVARPAWVPVPVPLPAVAAEPAPEPAIEPVVIERRRIARPARKVARGPARVLERPAPLPPAEVRSELLAVPAAPAAAAPSGYIDELSGAPAPKPRPPARRTPAAPVLEENPYLR